MSTCIGKTLSDRKKCKYYIESRGNTEECMWYGFKLDSGCHCSCVDAQLEARSPEMKKLLEKEKIEEAKEGEIPT
jgi:hypothetical protein